MDPTQVQAAYVRALKSRSGPGETMLLVRNGDATTYTVAAFLDPETTTTDGAGAVIQNARKVIVLDADVVSCGFPVPIRVKQDRVVWGTSSKSNAIMRVGERRIQGVLIAYELGIEGA